ncbi:MAG: aspartate kinase [Bacteroidales bacterium]
MKVLKFGGTSVGSSVQMKSVMNILITDSNRKIVVLSAMSGTTNSLVEIGECIKNGDAAKGKSLAEGLKSKYYSTIDELYSDECKKKTAKNIIDDIFNTIDSVINSPYTESTENIIVAQGELMSTNMFTLLMEENAFRVKLIPALEFMKIDNDKLADSKFIAENIKQYISDDIDYFITQGFICRNDKGDIDNLQRGGSDYTATLIGGAIEADEVEIWTDIDGFHNNDPRYVEGTMKIDELSFVEAAELAYFGAKILHPQTVFPTKEKNIPVRLKNTMNPQDGGTVINSNTTRTGIKAVAAKDGITAVKVRSARMLMAYGFMKRIFEVFDNYKTAIDMVTTSEVAVSMTIDNTKHLDGIVSELEALGEVVVEHDYSIVCLVGNNITESTGVAQEVLSVLKDTNIRMISFGGSSHNISVLIPAKDKVDTLRRLSESLLNKA